MGILEYSSNNSGGNFWLSLENWQALEGAGWVVHWLHAPNDPDHAHAAPADESDYWSTYHRHSYSDPLVSAVWNGTLWLDAPATSGAIETDDPTEAVALFERATGMNVDDKGCNCCGSPHYFSFTDREGKTQYFDSSPSGYDRGWG